MDADTIAVYDRRAVAWRDRRRPRHTDEALAFGRDAAPDVTGLGGPVVDLGCGPGWHTGALGPPVVALDASGAMLALAAEAAPTALRVQADLEALPFRSGSLRAGFASRSYVHQPRTAVPAALADLHRCLPPGAPVELVLFEGDLEHGPLPRDDFPGRRFSSWPTALLLDVVVGAGFDVDAHEVRPLRRDRGRPGDHHLRLRRARTLPDWVGPDLSLLVCGLNPSVYAADAGVGFARPGNRFWPAALAAGVVTADRDPWHALRVDRVGMTDLVKRATPRADALDGEEYRAGLARVERLVAWLRPWAVCVVGLAGWRAARDRRATAGPQPAGLGGRPVYLMPSTSGLNAHADLAALTRHLGAAAALA